MDLKYTPNPDGMMASLFPIYEWWAFGFLYGRQNWSEWSIKNANKCYLEFHREDGSKDAAEIHVYGDIKDAMPLLKDASGFFDIESAGDVSFFDAFTESTRRGKSFRISVKK